MLVLPLQEEEKESNSQSDYLMDTIRGFPPYNVPRRRPSKTESMKSSRKQSETFSSRESFFQTLTLIVHPIIILRLLCHKMFGSMLRRKIAHPTSPDRNSLTPPPISHSEICPPPLWSENANLGDMTERGQGTEQSRTSTNRNSTGASVSFSQQSGEVMSKFSKRVQVLMMTKERRRRGSQGAALEGEGGADDDSSQLRTRARTRRSGSMDKHLLRVGSSSKKRHSMHAAMTQAIKAIGDSLIQPLDDVTFSWPSSATVVARLQDSCTHLAPALDGGRKSRSFFHFPNLRDRSHSQGYITRLVDSASSDSLLMDSMKSSSQSIADAKGFLNKTKDKKSSAIRDFQRELINLPVFEVDTRQVKSPPLSRFSSVPDQLELLAHRDPLSFEDTQHNVSQSDSLTGTGNVPSQERNVLRERGMGVGGGRDVMDRGGNMTGNRYGSQPSVSGEGKVKRSAFRQEAIDHVGTEHDNFENMASTDHFTRASKLANTDPLITWDNAITTNHCSSDSLQNSEQNKQFNSQQNKTSTTIAVAPFSNTRPIDSASLQDIHVPLSECLNFSPVHYTDTLSKSSNASPSSSDALTPPQPQLISRPMTDAVVFRIAVATPCESPLSFSFASLH